MEKSLVLQIARKAIEYKLKNNEEWLPDLKIDPYKEFNEKRGAFTTLYIKENEKYKLRGCIGFTQPVFPIPHAIALSALKSAFEDPRFKPLTSQEYPQIVVDVEILDPLIEIKYDKNNLDSLMSQIELGKHGLMIKLSYNSGLLLPKVPTSYNWGIKTYLENLCYKAYLPFSALEHSETQIFSFTSTLYSEKSDQ